MSEIKTRVDFDEVSKLMGIATTITKEWPTNVNILSLVQARLKKIEQQAKNEVTEQKIEAAPYGGMPANMQTHRGPVEESFPAEDEDGDGDIDADDAAIADNKNKPVGRSAGPNAADTAHTPAGRRV